MVAAKAGHRDPSFPGRAASYASVGVNVSMCSAAADAGAAGDRGDRGNSVASGLDVRVMSGPQRLLTPDRQARGFRSPCPG